MKVFIGINAGSWKIGLEYAPISHEDGGQYMTRWIVYLLWFNLRLHHFFRGDYDRASHTHPWWFITFPFTAYWEQVYEKGVFVSNRLVRRLRFHWRSSNFEHIVLYPVTVGFDPAYPQYKEVAACHRMKPFWTFVIAGRPCNVWGFYGTSGLPMASSIQYGDE